MSRYESKTVTVQKPICEMFSRFSDLSFFEKQLEQLPEEQRAKLGEVHFAPDSISIVTPQVGELKFRSSSATSPTKSYSAARRHRFR